MNGLQEGVSGASACELVELQELMEARSSTYRLLARLFLKPLDDGDIDVLAQADYVEVAKAMGPDDPLSAGFNAMGRGLRRRHTGTKSVLASDYSRAFDGIASIDGKIAVPYASVFLSKKGLLYGPPRAEVLTAFRQQGVGLKDGVDLPEDHLSFELEFMGYLSDQAASALRAGDMPAAQQAVAESDRFLKQSILPWTDLLFELAVRLLETRFYQGVVAVTQAWLSLDEGVLADVATLLDGEAADADDAPPACCAVS